MKARIPKQHPTDNVIPLQLLPPEEMQKLTPGQQAQLNSASINLKKTIEKISNNSFVMGARTISKIAIKDYKPDIDAAKDYESLRTAVDKLIVFLSKGNKLQ